jgi:chromosome segregation ATPase
MNMRSHKPVAPDDTPTLEEIILGQRDRYEGPTKKAIDWLLAEVSRLREAQAKKQAESDYWRGKFNFADGALATAEADVSRLQQENALLRRSLEMLTKQLDEKDERITELTFTIIRHNSPA